MESILIIFNELMFKNNKKEYILVNNVSSDFLNDENNLEKVLKLLKEKGRKIVNNDINNIEYFDIPEEKLFEVTKMIKDKAIILYND